MIEHPGERDGEEWKGLMGGWPATKIARTKSINAAGGRCQSEV